MSHRPPHPAARSCATCLLRAAADAGGIALWEWRAPDGPTVFTGGWRGLLGRAPGPTLAAWEERLHPDERETVRGALASASTGGAPWIGEVRLRHDDGTWRWVRLELDATGTAPHAVQVVGIHVDVTAHHHTQEALRASEDLYRSLITAMAEGVVRAVGPEARVTAVNPAAERILGRSAAELVGRPLALEAWDEAGAVIPAEAQPAVVTARTGAPRTDVALRLRRPDGTERWVTANARPLGGPGDPAAVLTLHDDTDRRSLEERLRHAQKMEVVGRLAGGVAHDFNNLLAVIQLQATLLLGTPDTDPRVREGLGDVLTAAQRAAALSRQLLAFSRRSVTRPVPLDLREVIDGTLRLLRRVLGADVALRTDLAPSLPLVSADPTMMEQVVMNLAINAREAMPSGGSLTVSIGPERIDEARAARSPGARPGPHVRLSVADTGSGIAPEHLPHVFEPFFTTKPDAMGTGLGLATVQGIVQQHGGFVEVESAVGRGTTFHVHLPALAASAASEVGHPTPPPVPRGAETVLLVEDEPALRTTTRIVLERLGYRVLAAGSAAEALALRDRAGGPIHLLLTDLVLPGGTNGAELAAALERDDPDLRVLFTSGYGRELLERQTGLRPGWALLPKPYDAARLGTEVRARLDAQRSA